MDPEESVVTRNPIVLGLIFAPLAAAPIAFLSYLRHGHVEWGTVAMVALLGFGLGIIVGTLEKHPLGRAILRAYNYTSLLFRR